MLQVHSSGIPKFSFLLLKLVLCSTLITAQELSFPDIDGYRKNTGFPVYSPGNLWDYIDGAAEAYLGYGFSELHVAEYRKGKNIIKAEIYRMGDHTMAFGIYSSERSPGFRFIKLGSQGYVTGGVVNFFKGSYYVKIRTYSESEKVRQAAESLALRLAEMLQGETGMPAQLSLLPAQGRKMNEEMFIARGVLGHKFLNGAFKADYETGPDVFSVYYFDFNSAEEAWKISSVYLASAGTDTVESTEGKYVISDGYNGTVFLAWKDDKLVFISGLSKDQADIANRYTSEILK